MYNPMDEVLHRPTYNSRRYQVSRERGKPNADIDDDSERAGHDPREALWKRYWELCDRKYSLVAECRPQSKNEALEHERALRAAAERQELLRKISDPATVNPPKPEKRKPLTYILEHSELERKILSLRQEGVSAEAIAQIIGHNVVQRQAVH